MSQSKRRSKDTRVVADDYLTTEQLCEVFNRKPITLYSWRTKRGLPYLHVNKSLHSDILYDAEEVLEWAKGPEGMVIKNAKPIEKALGTKVTT